MGKRKKKHICFECGKIEMGEFDGENFWQCTSCGIYLHENEALNLAKYNKKNCLGVNCPSCGKLVHFDEL